MSQLGWEPTSERMIYYEVMWLQYLTCSVFYDEFMRLNRTIHMPHSIIRRLA